MTAVNLFYKPCFGKDHLNFSRNEVLLFSNLSKEFCSSFVTPALVYAILCMTGSSDAFDVRPQKVGEQLKPIKFS